MSDKNVFVIKEKHLAKESWEWQTIPINTITHVYLAKEKSKLLIISGILISVLGTSLTAFSLLSYFSSHSEISQNTFCVGMIVIGLIISFQATKRQYLVIEHTGGVFKWKPKLILDKANKTKVFELQKRILDVCEDNGIKVTKTLDN